MPAPKKDIDYIRALEARVARLEQRSSLANTGFTADAPKALTFDGSMHVTGEMDVDGPIDVHGTANFDGDTTIGGNMAVVGTLSLPAGIIDNDALANPVASAVAHTDAQGFAVTPSDVQILSTSVPVPAGYSRALILNMAVAVTAYNNTAGVDFLYCTGYVNGTNVGWQIGSMDVSATGTGVAYDVMTTMITGLAGGTITLTGKVTSAFGTWSASASNVANLDASILFIR